MNLEYGSVEKMLGLDKKNISKTVLAIPLAMVHSAYVWIGEVTETPISEIVMDRIFGRIGLESSGTVILTLENLCFSIFFNLIMAGYISDCFRCSCVYVFTRIRSRVRWVLYRVIEIYVYAMLYQALYMITTTLIGSRMSSKPLSQDDLRLLFTIYTYCILILMNTTLAVNFLAMKIGVITAFFVVQGIMLGLFMLALATRTKPVLIAMNPISCVGLLNYDLGMRAGILAINLSLLIMLLISGVRFVKGYDVALVDPEMN